MVTTLKTTPFDCIEASSNTYLEKIVDRLKHDYCVFFTDRGRNRLGYTLGWFRGLYDAGKCSEANMLANQFWERITQLGTSEKRGWWQADNASVRVPHRKVVLSDDGCDHSFSFAIYCPVPYQTWLDEFRKYWNDRNEYTWDAARREAFSKLSIRTDTDSFESWVSVPKPCWKEGDYGLCADTYNVYYRYQYNGGLIFHGGSNETFACRIGSSDNAWGIHT